MLKLMYTYISDINLGHTLCAETDIVMPLDQDLLSCVYACLNFMFAICKGSNSHPPQKKKKKKKLYVCHL